MVAVVWPQQDSTTLLQGQGTRDYGVSLFGCDKYEVTSSFFLPFTPPLLHIDFQSSHVTPTSQTPVLPPSS
ncbi:hypothetical protein NQZ68_017444 [Dissostichus eleginoides]|nr:hypothetical protein NQZ68_017444 [Dissostichus eleginoides]